MNPETPSSHSLEKTPSYGYVSSGSESRKPSDSGKKRASRAGTRSVTSLSAAQLERKRANDREAQRAIRQRTKDHIDSLEKSITDLRLSQNADKRSLVVTQQRNRELEDEVVYLRGRLTEAGYTVPVPQGEGRRQRDTVFLAAPTDSPAGHTSDSAESASAKHSISSSAPSQSSSSRQGSWQQHGAYPSSAPGAPIAMPGPGQAPAAQNLSQWRSQEQVHSVQGVPPASREAQNPNPAVHSIQYGPPSDSESVQWNAPASYPYQASPAGQRAQPYQHSPQHPQQPYTQQTTVPSYSQAAPQPPQPQTQQQQQQQQQQQPQSHPPYHPAQLPQAEFQNMAVSSPGPYQMPQQTIHPQQQTFGQPGQYQVSPMQVPQLSSGYAQPQGQMQYPHQGQGDQPYPAQQPQTPMEYRDAKLPGYHYGQYPT